MGDLQQFDVAVRNSLQAGDRDVLVIANPSAVGGYVARFLAALAVRFGTFVFFDNQAIFNGAVTFNAGISGAGLTPGVASAPAQPAGNTNCPAGTATAIPFGVTLTTAAMSKAFVKLAVFLRWSNGATPPTAIAVTLNDGNGHNIGLNLEPGTANGSQGWFTEACFPPTALAAGTLTPSVTVQPTGQTITMQAFCTLSAMVLPSQ